PRDLGEGAAQLERAGSLQVLALEQQPRAAPLARGLEVLEWRSNGVPADHGRHRVDPVDDLLGERPERLHARSVDRERTRRARSIEALSVLPSWLAAASWTGACPAPADLTHQNRLQGDCGPVYNRGKRGSGGCAMGQVLVALVGIALLAGCTTTVTGSGRELSAPPTRSHSASVSPSSTRFPSSSAPPAPTRPA